MARHFGDEVPLHLEFVRFGGQIACFGLQLVRYTTDERLLAIIDHHNRNGCPVFNPHAYTLEGGGMKQVDQVQLAFKREADPLGLLNPGKMIGWDDPAYDESADRQIPVRGRLRQWSQSTRRPSPIAAQLSGASRRPARRCRVCADQVTRALVGSHR